VVESNDDMLIYRNIESLMHKSSVITLHQVHIHSKCGGKTNMKFFLKLVTLLTDPLRLHLTCM
jgi:hypothetical protein